MREARCSIVNNPRSNAVSGSAEPLMSWRRQYPQPVESARVEGLPGVTGRTCEEVHSREDGRSCNVQNAQTCPIIKHPTAGCGMSARNGVKVRDDISVTRERHPHALQEVRGAYSSDEPPVMGVDAKWPRFDGGIGAARGSPSRGGA